MARIFFHYINFSITQSAIVDEQFSNIFPDKPHNMIPHPVYDHFGPPVDRSKARYQLGLPLNKKILLFFGFIRPYKGLDLFLNIFPEIIKNSPDIHLVVAGECFGPFDNYEKLIIRNNLSQHITTNIGYIDNSQIPLYFSAADILIMPYRSATNSGVMEIAKFYGLPIIASDIKAFRKGARCNCLYFASTSDSSSYIRQIKNIANKKFPEDLLINWRNFVEKISPILDAK